MSLVNNLKKVVDLPIFELCNQTNSLTTALSATCTAEDSTGRYIYYFNKSYAVFQRYDTYTDTWSNLAYPPNTLSNVVLSMTYTSYRGFNGVVLNATANTVMIGGRTGGVLHGATLSIERGIGLGQERVLSYVAVSYTHLTLPTKRIV